jgi:hypothetical protein
MLRKESALGNYLIIIRHIFVFNIFPFRLIAEKFGPIIMQDGSEDDKWNPEPLNFFLGHFSGRTNMTLDIFARGIIDFLQLKLGKQLWTEGVFKQLAAANANIENGYSINIENDSHVKLINDLFSFLKNDEGIKAGSNELTMRTQTGASVILSREGYDVYKFRNQINTIFKTKTGNPALSLTIETVPLGHPELEAEDADFSELGLDDYKLKGLPDQAFWTVGDGPDSDIILAKANVTFGPHFTVFNDGGKFYVKDNSYIS